MPEFYMIFARKNNKIPEFYMTYARKMNKMLEFYLIFPRKILFPIFLRGGGGGGVPPAPVSYAYVGENGVKVFSSCKEVQRSVVKFPMRYEWNP